MTNETRLGEPLWPSTSQKAFDVIYGDVRVAFKKWYLRTHGREWSPSTLAWAADMIQFAQYYRDLTMCANCKKPITVCLCAGEVDDQGKPWPEYKRAGENGEVPK